MTAGLADLDLMVIVTGLDRALASAILLTSFSLLVYVVTHNILSPVGRAFSALMAFVALVYVGDVAVQSMATPDLVALWLRFQWLGIALVPAAYLHLSYALLQTVNARPPGGRFALVGVYGIGLVFLTLSITTDLVVWDGVYDSGAAHLKSGPLFWLFAIYFAGTTVFGAVNISVARQRAMTRASRRRLTYLAAAFAAPALGVFPFLVIAGLPSESYRWLVSLLSIIGNAAVMLMLVVMTYSVAYYGVLAPERVVKRSFIQYVLRGPFVGMCVLMVMLAVPDDMEVLGITSKAFRVFSVVVVIVVLEVLISVSRPLTDRLAYRQDRGEVAWLRELEDRLMTTTDFRQVLENVVVSACELMRRDKGFIATLPMGDMAALSVETAVGRIDNVPGVPDVVRWLQAQSEARQGRDGDDVGLTVNDLLAVEGYWLVALFGRSQAVPLGILGLGAPEGAGRISATEEEVGGLERLARRAADAIEDMNLQRQVFSALHCLLPEIDEMQHWRGTIASGTSQLMLANPVLSPEFPSLVRAALRHYWGGSQLRESPLLQLRVVRQALSSNDGNPIKALRAVLTKAIEALRPGGERDTSPEWTLYNVLEMKYVQGLKAKEIAKRLAMSESDLYRKQRVAVRQVARILAEMEIQAGE